MTLTTFLVAETYFECLVRQEFDPDAEVNLGGNGFCVGRVHMILGPHLPKRVARRIRERAASFAAEVRRSLDYLNYLSEALEDEPFELNAADLTAEFKLVVWPDIHDQFDPLEGV